MNAPDGSHARPDGEQVPSQPGVADRLDRERFPNLAAWHDRDERSEG